jgi:hypothetical protein
MFGCLCSEQSVRVETNSQLKEDAQTSSINSWTVNDIQSIMEPMTTCIGIIHDFLRPIEGK